MQVVYQMWQQLLLKTMTAIASLRLVMTHRRQTSVTIRRLQHLHSLLTSKLLKQLLLMTMATVSQAPAILSIIPLQLKIQET